MTFLTVSGTSRRCHTEVQNPHTHTDTHRVVSLSCCKKQQQSIILRSCLCKSVLEATCHLRRHACFSIRKTISPLKITCLCFLICVGFFFSPSFNERQLMTDELFLFTDQSFDTMNTPCFNKWWLMRKTAAYNRWCVSAFIFILQELHTCPSYLTLFVFFSPETNSLLCFTAGTLRTEFN